MKQKAIDYAREWYRNGMSAETAAECGRIIKESPELCESLWQPTITAEKKHSIIEKVFPENAVKFIEELCDNYDIEMLAEITEAYDDYAAKAENITKAQLIYYTPPSVEQLDGIKEFLKKEFKSKDARLELTEDKSIMGGFIIRVDDTVFDHSIKGRIESLGKALAKRSKKASISSDKIISIIKSEIDNYEISQKNRETGEVTYIGDGVARLTGIDHAMYGEIIMFENGVKGMVQDIRRNEIGCILLGKEAGVHEGTKVSRTGRMAGVPVGSRFIGRIVNALGEPIDGGPEIEADDYYPIEREAPGIVERQSVSVPLETGILAIDSMFPIGRGQRELIIGDRQTGKTSIAIDTIINQKGKGVICVYVAVGQKASTVARLVSTFKQHGALDYTIVVSSTASESASVQYIAPYAGTAMAEYFMHMGKDVLIVYDDLSKHAVAYRALSLLLERSPGREAYPGDVFYLHSRLLERSSRLSPEYGGGSITALPIIETQAGDVSAYIPTNVISITDGQIFLESDLFFSGMRPAVNVGLSVSRVGGAAQTKAMKRAAGSIRIDLAQYREMEIFTQFASDLDDATKEQLAYGKGLYELLKQPLYRPLSMAEQVITLCLATNKVMIDVPESKIKKFQMDILEYFDSKHPEIVTELTQLKTLTDDLRDSILAVGGEYKKSQELLS